ncbi:hypothetical protein [Aurantibacter sp.]|uniref:hypothetical protein n=1 Tax=Aurantibacter sp. TaxID=2807103 RepID=UPI0035C7E8E4
MKEKNKDEFYDIINNEIKIVSISENQNVNLYLNQNEYLIGFLENINQSNSDNLKKYNLDKDVVASFFNKDVIKNILDQAKSNNSINLKKIQLQSNMKISEVKEKITTSEYLKGSLEYEIYLSRPLISLNNKYAIVSFSKGFKQAMEGGIVIYENIDLNWKRIKFFDSWIE